MNQKQIDIQYMRRCLQLAENGLGGVSPNPLVGCVIVYENRIISEGWHRKAGLAHAEVNAINNVKDKALLSKTTIYVNLEPCSHYGKTPPCADLLVKHKVKRVVIGTIDPFAKVAGRGIKKLLDAGISVTYPVLTEDCHALNKRFFCYHQKKRPYIFLKWAQTEDGFINAPQSDVFSKQNKSLEISNLYARQQVHRLRTIEDAFLIGSKTALVDNPKLSARLWKGKNPMRVLIDRNLKTPSSSFLFNDKAKTLVINEEKQAHLGNVFWGKVNFNSPVLPQICTLLYEKNVQSMVVEGGAYTLQSFIDANLWDETWVYASNKKMQLGTKAPRIKDVILKEVKNIGSDNYLFIYKNGGT